MANVSQKHVASVTITIAGAEIPLELRKVLLEVKVRESVSVPSSAFIRFNDPGLQQVDKPVFEIGKEIEIKAGGLADTSKQSIFKGEIVAFEPEFTKGGCVIALRAYDKSHRLQRSRKVRTFQDVTATDIVKRLTQEAGLGGSADPTSAKFKFFLQSGETDRELIRRFEREYNFQFFVENGSYKFRSATASGGPIATLKYGEGLMAFRPRISSAQQVKQVEVRGWDPAQKKEIVSTATNGGTVSTPGLRRSTVETAFANNKVLVADRVIENTQEAQKVAQASIDGRAEAYVEAEGQCLGNPKLHAGKKIKIEGVGTKLSGEYVMTSVTHWYRGEKGYYTNFEITGRSPRGLLDLVHPPEKRDWASHLVVALVTNVNDPDKLGRVKVKFPVLPDDRTSQPAESFWARVVTTAASNNRGLLMLPEVDDEVVVAFENGDARRPLVIGALFNGRNKPGDELLQTQDGSFSVVSNKKAFVHTKEDLTFKSDKKMILQITGDREEKTDAKLKSEAGSSAELKAGSSYTIEAGSSMTIKGASITVEAQGSLKLKGATVDIESQGPATLKGATVDVQGQAMTNIKGAIVNLG
jgi:uncharacterized protein involved in type VI secretion and phage assembly